MTLRDGKVPDTTRVTRQPRETNFLKTHLLPVLNLLLASRAYLGYKLRFGYNSYARYIYALQVSASASDL